MRWTKVLLVLVWMLPWVCVAPTVAQTIASGPVGAASNVVIPGGTQLSLVNTRAVWAASAKAGEPVYLQVLAPVEVGGATVAPAGTYVLASIDQLLMPDARNSEALMNLRLEQIIFPNGYTVGLPANTVSLVTVKTTTANDLVLDSGTAIPFQLTASVPLDAKSLATAGSLARTPGPFAPATLCRDQPGSPGTPADPGTPDTTIGGSPGTPDTVIVNADGSTTTIPGIPATPPTVIPGRMATPGTPDTPPTYCPDPPWVQSSVPTAPGTALAFPPAPPKAVKVKKKKKKKPVAP